MSPSVLCFGEALVDFFPPRRGIPLERCETFTRHLGGAPCNVAVGLARQGVPVGMMTLVGPDAFGRFVRARLAEEGVDVAAVGTHPTAKTGITFVSVADDGARSFLFFRHPSADQMISPAEVDAARVAAADVLHLGSSTLSREPARAATHAAVDAARRAGRLVSADPNWRPHLWPEATEAARELAWLVTSSDVLKISDDELEPLAGSRDAEAAATQLLARGPSLVIVTQAARGCTLWHAGGHAHVATEPLDAVDATGAGDAFVAGVLASLIADGVATPLGLRRAPREVLVRACAAGNRLGGQAVRALGATTSVLR